MFEFLLWPFVIRALIIGLILALSTAMISNFLVSSNQSLIGDGLSPYLIYWDYHWRFVIQ